MNQDKYSAVWVSHSSISDYLKCPRSYYLRNIYKNPKTGRKMTVMKPALALGQAVHEVIESLAVLPKDERFKVSLVKKLDPAWLKIAGKKGGFGSFSEEKEYRDRAIRMLTNLQENPGPLTQMAIKIKTGKMNLPNFYLSQEENIILCGKIDWLTFNETNNSVTIIDFKTGKNEENQESLQLPIYLLLATNTQRREVEGALYWYLDRDEGMVKMELPKYKDAYKLVMNVAMKIKIARKDGNFSCPAGGCNACRMYERILNGEGEFVGISETNQDIYIISK